jgi:hypothetical protein
VWAVCAALGLSRSNIVAKQNCSLDWVDCRGLPSKTDDVQAEQAIADLVKARATHGYKRVWAKLRIEGRRINQRCFYRVGLEAVNNIYDKPTYQWHGRGLLQDVQ